MTIEPPRMSSPLFLATLCLALAVLSCRREQQRPATEPAPAPAAPVESPPINAAAPAPVVTMEALATAALEGDLTIVKQALTQPGAATHADPEGRTALMLAAFNGHTQIADLILQAGARIDARDQTGRSALMYACSGANDAVVALLLKRGAGVNLTDNDEHWTPLMFAAAEGHTDVARRLLAAGADPTAADVDGEDAARFARNRNFTQLADLLDKAKLQAQAAKHPSNPRPADP